MTGQDDSKLPGPGFPPEDSGSGDDVVELGGRRRPASGWRLPPIAVILAAAGLLAGLIGGYAAGDRHSRNSAAPPSNPAPSSPAPSRPAAPSAAGALAVEQSGRQCSAQLGRALQLGVQVTNLSAASVTLRRVQAVLPLGGLKATSQAWGPCGELPVADTEPDNVLPAGASTWFSVTFQVLVACPSAFPVQFTLDYDQRGRPATVALPGFVDLGHVPYAGCP